MRKGSLVMNMINIDRMYIPTLPALCLGTSVPRQKHESERSDFYFVGNISIPGASI